jgi:hypothetical protein
MGEAVVFLFIEMLKLKVELLMEEMVELEDAFISEQTVDLKT